MSLLGGKGRWGELRGLEKGLGQFFSAVGFEGSGLAGRTVIFWILCQARLLDTSF